MENTYTDDEVREMLTDIGNVIASEIECELINSSHTNVLVLQQVFAQAQKWHLDLDADLAELENRGQFVNDVPFCKSLQAIRTVLRSLHALAAIHFKGPLQDDPCG